MLGQKLLSISKGAEPLEDEWISYVTNNSLGIAAKKIAGPDALGNIYVAAGADPYFMYGDPLSYLFDGIETYSKISYILKYSPEGNLLKSIEVDGNVFDIKLISNTLLVYVYVNLTNPVRIIQTDRIYDNKGYESEFSISFGGPFRINSYDLDLIPIESYRRVINKTKLNNTTSDGLPNVFNRQPLLYDFGTTLYQESRGIYYCEAFDDNFNSYVIDRYGPYTSNGSGAMFASYDEDNTYKSSHVTKRDRNGNVIWSKVFSTTSGLTDVTELRGRVICVDQSTDSIYVAMIKYRHAVEDNSASAIGFFGSAMTYTNKYTAFNQFNIVRLSATTGNVIWVREITQTDYDEITYTGFQQTAVPVGDGYILNVSDRSIFMDTDSQGNLYFVITNPFFSRGFQLTKVDVNGNIVWARTLNVLYYFYNWTEV